MSDEPQTLKAARDRWSLRWPIRGAVVALALAGAFLALPPLAGVPIR
jgi:hypothetical protein